LCRSSRSVSYLLLGNPLLARQGIEYFPSAEVYLTSARFLKIQLWPLLIKMAGSFSLRQWLRMPTHASQLNSFLVTQFDAAVGRLFIGARGDEALGVSILQVKICRS
jgi:hypothetical protein